MYTLDIGGFCLMLTALQNVCKEASIRADENVSLEAPEGFVKGAS